MRIVDPATGTSYFKKCRRRINAAGHARELTFSCYRRFSFFSRERTCEWFREANEVARKKFTFGIWAYVLMPDHVHLLVYPGDRAAAAQVPRFLQAVKEPVARQAIEYLKANAPQWLARLTVQEGQRVRHRFWQPGGGYDRNITSARTLRAMIEYIHATPVRRGLVARTEDWEWSPVKIEMDAEVLDVVARG